jgi:outer membrane protein, multidrug efflux system
MSFARKRLSRLTAFPTAGLLATALVAGCAVGPDYQTPFLDLPARFAHGGRHGAAAPQNLTRWWASLRDRMLSQLIEEAVAGNLDVAAAKARIREARAVRVQAVAGLFPTVDGSGSVTGNKIADTTGATFAAPYTLYKAGFDASFELDLFGANKRTLEAANRGLEATWDDLEATLLTLVGDVASNYVEARGYQARIELARRTAASQKETADLIKSKLDAGSSSAMDYAKASALASATAANIPLLEIQYAQAAHRLGILLGREPGAMLPRLDRPAPIPAPRLPLRPGIPADILLTRPDVRKAERELAQYTAKIGAAEAALYPSVSLTGSVSTAAQKTGDIGKGSTIAWTYGPSLTVPVFNAGRLRAAVDAAEAERDRYHLAFRSAVLTALEDVENGLVSLSKERARAARLAQSARSYREAARLARALYDAGAASFLDVLDAERSLYSAQDTLLQSQVSISVDYVALAKALGGGWSGMIDVSKPEVVDAATAPHPVEWRAVTLVSEGTSARADE